MSLLFSALPPAAWCQVAGRWRLTVTGGVPVSIRGELRLAGFADRLTGTLALETRDTVMAVSEAHLGAGGSIAFRVALDGGLRFSGALSESGMRGQVAASDGLARVWTASRLAPDEEYYPAMPQYMLRQIVSGEVAARVRVPGAWLAVATTPSAIKAVAATYRRLARAADLSEFTPPELPAGRPMRALGLLRRTELVSAAERTLADIREGIASDSVRQRFDLLFRPRGKWLVDLHETALDLAQTRDSSLTWRSALPAAGAGSGANTDEAIALAVYRLWVQSVTDSGGFASAMQESWRRDSVSAGRLRLLLNGYTAAEKWFVEAVRFFLNEPWVVRPAGPSASDPDPGVSLADLVREAWHDRSLPVPEIQTRLFGYAQAAPRVAVPPQLFDRLVVVQNRSGTEWLRRHGRAELLLLLRRLTPVLDENATLDLGTSRLRMTTVGREAARNLNGFLEPKDAIVIDPGYVPLLALGTVIHEWQHILFERQRLRPGDPGFPPGPADVVVLRSADRYLAEGFAEWRSETILEPLESRLPLLALGEAEKRAALLGAQGDDPHLLGYLLVRALAGKVADRDRLVALLVRGSGSLSAVARDPIVAAAFAPFRHAPDRLVPSPDERVLVPETRFTVEDFYPDVISVRVLLPGPTLAPIFPPSNPR
ncbi:MAG: hypothetical protein ACREMO_02265 [Gemmatimonadales bacterium]